MCGISLIISKKTELLPRIYEMNNKIIHRGPDDEGVYMGHNFALGHRRLSILDLSSAGHQPMQYNDLIITYNGEVYNYIELKKELSAMGYSFKTNTDTEVILAAYKQWGTASFSKFNGMWAFAIYDIKANELILCRDHFGIKPLNYYVTNNYFAAGSEIKQFTVFEDFDTTLDTDVVINFLSLGKLNYSENTFFKNVKELRGGHHLIYNLNTHKYKIERWYNLNKCSGRTNDSYALAQKKVYNLLVNSLKLRNRSDVPVGSCLSGGIDSSSMVSAIHANQLNAPQFKTISSCFENKKYDEQQYSNAITNQTGFKALKVFPDLKNLIDKNHWEKIIYHQDQPIPSASHYSEYNVFKTARENELIVMLDGQGADEYFGGYGEFFQCRQWELFKQLNLFAVIKNLYKKGVGNGKGFKTELSSFYHTTLFLADIKKFIKRTLKKEDINFSWLKPYYQKIYLKHEHLFSVPKNIRFLSIEEIESSSIPYQLHSEDRNSMMFSVESRIPFLDHNLVEYTIGLPSNYKVKGEINKAILRDSVKELPEIIKNRKDKMGFVAPEEPWFFDNSNTLRNQLIEALDSHPALFEKERVLRMFDQYIIVNKIYLPLFFRIISFHKWFQIFNAKY